jgi:dihydroorotate dehydrogenase (fumarate)
MKLETTLMGLSLKNPFVIGANPWTGKISKLKELEAAGASAVVLPSLFEEKIQLEKFQHQESMHKFDDLHAEMLTQHPNTDYAGAEIYLHFIKQAKSSLSIPVFASLNALTSDTWIHYAKKIEEAGADGLELNLYHTAKDPNRSSQKIEQEQLQIVQQLRSEIKIPLSVKLSPYYTNTLHFIQRLEEIGANGYVLYNRFFEEEIDTEREILTFPLRLSHGTEYTHAMKTIGLLYGTVKGDLIATSGLHTTESIIQVLLAGASAVQVVSLVHMQSPSILKTLIEELTHWMDQKGYGSLEAFRGSLSKKNQQDPYAFERGQYIDLLLKGKVL